MYKRMSPVEIPDSPAGFLESGRGYPQSATRQFIVEGIRTARRQPARDLVHNLNDLQHDIAAVATGGGLEQITNRGADLRLGIVGADEIPIVLI